MPLQNAHDKLTVKPIRIQNKDRTPFSVYKCWNSACTLEKLYCTRSHVSLRLFDQHHQLKMLLGKLTFGDV